MRSHSGYHLIPSDDDDKRLVNTTLPTYNVDTGETRRARCFTTHLVRLVVLMVMAVGLLRASSLSRGFWAPCSRLLATTPQRNFSTTHPKPKLPSHYILPSGDTIPAVALGCWQAGKGEVGEAVKTALKAGYRHVDGAWAYRNEEEVGTAIKESGVPREDIWLTSKLWNNFHSPEDVEPALDDTLKRLGTDYLDLYLIHWPVAFKKNPGPNGENVLDHGLTEDPYPTWRALEAVVAKGKVRNIGVSNFNINRIKNLTANPLRVQPAVNQVELSYWNPQPELLKWSKANGLLLEAYSPLGGAKQVKESLQIPEVKEIATQLSITPAQVLISWAIQRGTVVLPKSVTPKRVEENFKVTPLPEELFDKLEQAAASHPPQRVVNPSKGWGLGYDVFEWGN